MARDRFPDLKSDDRFEVFTRFMLNTGLFSITNTTMFSLIALFADLPGTKYMALYGISYHSKRAKI